MRGRRGTGLLLLAATLALLGGCAGGAPRPVGPAPNQPPARTTWALHHRVVESADLHVIGHGISSYDEYTGVSLGRGGDESCYVSVSAPGQGGPDLMAGEKLATTFRGRPAFRNGAGAEAAYLVWQRADTSWVQVTCDPPEETGPVDIVAKAVRLSPSSIALPFGLTELPRGYEVAQIMQDRGATKVYVGQVSAPFGSPDSDLEISYEARDPLRTPSGRAVTVGGRPALLDEEPRSPEVCVSVQERHVCVGITPSDTGPYPDRSAEVPTLLDLAAHLTVADDLDDRSTWMAAEDVFG